MYVLGCCITDDEDILLCLGVIGSAISMPSWDLDTYGY